MPDMETLLAELFAFQRFEPNERLQNMINDRLSRYDDDFMLSTDDLAAAAGGINVPPPDDSEGSDKK